MNLQLNSSSRSVAHAPGRSGFSRWWPLPLLIALSAVQLSAAPDFSMKGWATTGSGTTGGAGGETVTVTSPEELITYMESPDPLIIQVKGTIDVREDTFPGYSSIGRYTVASNKTIIGIGDDAHIRGIELRLGYGASNIIIRNLTLSDSYDTAIAVSGGTSHVWIDHNEIYGAPDGLVDITTGSNFVTVSWNRLHSAVRGGLAGRRNDKSSDEDAIRVTFHHNWYNNLEIRAPHAYWGRHHIFNNYYTNISQTAIEVGAGTRIVAENNYFDTVRRAYFVRDSLDEWDMDPGALLRSGSIYKNIEKEHELDQLPDNPVNWHPTDIYSYSLDDAADVPQIVMNYSGVGVVDPQNDDGTPPPDDEEPKEPVEAVGLIAEYPLTEGSGDTATDKSGFGDALNLTLSGDATWIKGGGIEFVGGSGKLQSQGSTAKLADQISGTGEFTVEVWAKATVLDQSGPSRVFTYSEGTSNRNVTLGHGGPEIPNADLAFRVRTTTEGDANGVPEIVAEDEVVGQLSHYVVTFDGSLVRIYRDGNLRKSVQREGDLTNWDSTYALVLGNEATSTRGWTGEIHNVAIFDKALDESEIQTRFDSSDAVEPEPEVGFNEWLGESYPDQESPDPFSDPGGYGIPLLMRYAFNLEPHQPDRRNFNKISTHVDPDNGAEHLSIEFKRRTNAEGAAIRVEVSDDLQNWEQLGEEAMVSVVENGDFETVIVRDPTPIGEGEQRFIRLKVELLAVET